MGISQKKRTKIKTNKQMKKKKKPRKINLEDQCFFFIFTAETLEASNNVQYLRITEEKWFPTNNSIPGLLQVIF